MPHDQITNKTRVNLLRYWGFSEFYHPRSEKDGRERIGILNVSLGVICDMEICSNWSWERTYVLSDSEVHRRDETIDFRIAIRFFEQQFFEKFSKVDHDLCFVLGNSRRPDGRHAWKGQGIGQHATLNLVRFTECLFVVIRGQYDASDKKISRGHSYSQIRG